MTNEREVNKRRKVYKRWLFIETSCAGSLSKAESLSGASSFSLISTHASSLHTHTPYKRLFIVNTETYGGNVFLYLLLSFFVDIIPTKTFTPKDSRTRSLQTMRTCALFHVQHLFRDKCYSQTSVEVHGDGEIIGDLVQ